MTPSVRPGNSIADEFFLALLDRDVDLFVGAFQVARVIPGLADVAGREKHTRDHQLFHGVGIRAGSVEHRHAALGQRRDRNIVGAGAGAATAMTLGGNVDRVHVRRADQHCVGIDRVSEATS